MKEKLKQLFLRRQKKGIIDPARTSAAVLVPIYEKKGQYYLLLIKRTDRVKVHKAQVSFPGGVYEPEDRTLLSTALRETTEEIGLVTEHLEILGELDDEVSVSTNYVISPFVAYLPHPFQFQKDEVEVAEILEIPVSTLLDSRCRQQEILNGQRIAYSYHYQGERIWGATARILKQFLDIWSQALDQK